MNVIQQASPKGVPGALCSSGELGGTTPLAMRALASPRLGAEQGALVECGGTGRLALSSQLDTALTVAQ